MENCPCGLQKKYKECCGRFIDGHDLPATPEELMRSRYTAYTKINLDYIQATMVPPASNHFVLKEAYEWAKGAEWNKLEVVNISQDANDIGFVEFVVTFKQRGKDYVLHEVSEFHLRDGKWLYVNGRDPRVTPPFTTYRSNRNLDN